MSGEGFSLKDLEEIRNLVLHDLETSGAANWKIVLFDGRSRVGTDPRAHRLVDGDVGDTADLFVQVREHWMRVRAASVSSAAAHVLWQIQDDIVAEMNTAWPVVKSAVEGTLIPVFPKAEPEVSEPGWYAGPARVCAIGSLSAVPTEPND